MLFFLETYSSDKSHPFVPKIVFEFSMRSLLTLPSAHALNYHTLQFSPTIVAYFAFLQEINCKDED